MNSRTARHIAIGQICFGFFIAVCVALHPGFVLKWNEGGMSNYGVHAKTVVPYTLALGLVAGFSYSAARWIDRSDAVSARLRRVLVVYGWLVVAVLVSTYFYSLNTTLRDVHMTIGTGLTAFAAGASWWMYRLSGGHALDAALLGVQLLGDVLALATLVGALHVLFASEVLAWVGYGSLLVRTGRRVSLGEV